MKPYYADSRVTLYHADCRDVLPSLTFDAAVTDPPYGLGFPYLSYSDTRESLVGLIGAVMPALRAQAERVFVLCGPTQIALYPAADRVSCVTWNTTGSFGLYGYSQWMPVLCYGKDIAGFGNVNGATKADTLRISGAGVGFHRSSDEAAHTCPKPINVMRMVVNRFTPPTATIVDPFAGAGTTLLAAKTLGRKAVGIELEERYCEIVARRLSQEVLPFGTEAA